MDSRNINGTHEEKAHSTQQSTSILAKIGIPSDPEPSEIDHQNDTTPGDTPRKQRNLKPSISSQLSFREDDERSEDDDHEKKVDPAWGIKRTDSANILETIHKSSSFPVATVAAREPDSYEVPINTEEQQDEVPATPPLDGRQHEDITREPIQIDQTAAREERTIGLTRETDYFQAEKERFDEGIPLIEHEQHSDHAALFDPLDESAATTADSFFARTNGTDALEQSMSLQRKDTDQVLGTLGVLDRRSDSPPPPADDELRVTKQPSTEPKEITNAFATDSQEEEDPWQAILADDDDGFLVEDADDLLPDSDDEPQLEVSSPRPQVTLPQPQQGSAHARSNASYTPHQPSTAEMSYFSGASPAGLGLQKSPFAPFQPQNLRPTITERAASYVDQNKVGYKSPYDLPVDLAPKPKTRPQRPTPAISNMPPPPPRTTSIGGEKSLQSPFTPATPGFGQPSASVSSPVLLQSPVSRAASVPVRANQPPGKHAATGFFEELPVTARVRPQPASRMSSTQPVQTPYLTAAPSGILNQPQATPLLPPLPPIPQDPYAQYQLQAPEKLDPYSNTAMQAPATSESATANKRYSPAPPTVPGGTRPSPSPRYSPASPSNPGPRYSPAPTAQTGSSQNRYVAQAAPAQTQQFLPRTSSPLAQHRRSVDHATQRSAPDVLPQLPSENMPTASAPVTAMLPPSSALSPGRSTAPTKQPGLPPPRRSQTQSPSQQISKSNYTPRPVVAPNRPQSAFSQMPPLRVARSSGATSTDFGATTSRPVIPDSDFVRPQSDMQLDPLQRWRGSAIMRFGFGGNVVTSFPVHTPRFSAGSTRPQIKVSPGEVRIRSISDVYNLPEHITKFPGPLKGKSKKKDVLVWLSSCITTLDAAVDMQASGSNASKRTHEKVMLWKVVRALVEHDGNLESPQALQSVNAILMPEIYTVDDLSSPQYRGDEGASGIYRPASMSIRNETTDASAMEDLRKALLKGKREDAVWQAVDARLWSHALLLASTLDRKVWRQVVQDFVRQEVKTTGANAESLCAFYEILGGNFEESVDQLVPPSARAGLQMVNTIDATGPSKNALDGLDKWRETLCLVLNNRNPEDQKALVMLSRLLSDYGRVEASHICHIFARSLVVPNIFGGADDPNTGIVLLGADHRNKPSDFHRDSDAILLTEVYEFAMSTLSSGATGISMPHLAVYKLHRANELIDAGLKSEAQAYCDAIASGLRSNTKQSMYYHPLLLGQVEDLSNRLKQAPAQGQSWMQKPTIEKVSGTFFKKMNSFITGEDSDAESKGSARDASEAGPLGNMAGSPSISRNASQSDLYGAYPVPTSVAPTAAGSRYAPNGMSSARSSSELIRGRQSLELQRSPPSTTYMNEVRSSVYAPMMQQQQQHSTYSPLGTSPSGYESQPGLEPSMPVVAEETLATQTLESFEPDMSNPYMTEQSSIQPAFGGYAPPEPQVGLQQSSQPQWGDSFHQEPPTSTYEPHQSSYSAYAPPEDASYVPYQPDPDSENDEAPQPKKRTTMDDDDTDDFPRVSNVPTRAPAAMSAQPDTAEAVRRKANDEAANAAFLAAAAADANRDKENSSANSNKKPGGSWLGGWFGGSKKVDSLDTDSSSGKGGPGKVYRAKLGESKMKLYYDKEKGRWINPENPDAGEKKTIAPPPRSGSVTPGMTGPPPPPPAGSAPPRAVSSPLATAGSSTANSTAAPPLPPLPASRSGTPAYSDDSRPGTSSGSGLNPHTGIAATLPPTTNASLGLASPPPSSSVPRPSSALSTATGLDDLLGGPVGGARKASGKAGARGGRKGRYVDVMAK